MSKDTNCFWIVVLDFIIALFLILAGYDYIPLILSAVIILGCCILIHFLISK